MLGESAKVLFDSTIELGPMLVGFHDIVVSPGFGCRFIAAFTRLDGPKPGRSKRGLGQ